MKPLQTYFHQFNENIRISYDEDSTLREKRDILLKEIRAFLSKKFPQNTPKFDTFNQGSYDLGT